MKRKLIQGAKDFKEWVNERNTTRCESCSEKIAMEPGEEFDEFFQRYEPKGHSRWGTTVDHKQYYCADCVEVDSL